MTAADRAVTVAFLDLVKFTTATAIHGDAAAVELLDRFMSCVEEAAQDRAEVVKTLGDGVLLTAETPEEGVAAAIHVLTRFHDEPGLPDVAGGLHHGPVIRRGTDVLGGTVNLASRLSESAGPAELHVTTEIARAVTALSVPARPLGSRRIRGVPEPVDVVALQPCDHDADRTVVDPICGMRLLPGPDIISRDRAGERVWYCALHCADLDERG